MLIKNHVYKILFCVILVLLCSGCDAISPTTKESHKVGFNVVSSPPNQTRQYMELSVIGSWSGEESKKINFITSESPWVINFGYLVTSKLGNTFDITVVEKGRSGTILNSYGNTLIKQSGEFIIVVQSSGCKWWVKVGIE